MALPEQDKAVLEILQEANNRDDVTTMDFSGNCMQTERIKSDSSKGQDLIIVP